MSILSTCEVKCKCGETFESQLWKAISISDDPDLKNILVSGQFNVVECPVCHNMFYHEHFFVYQDIKNEFVAFVYPKQCKQEYEVYKQKMLNEFNEVAKTMENEIKIDFEPQLFFGIEELIEHLNFQDYMKDEIDVLEFIANQLELELVAIKPSVARSLSVPYILPKTKGNNNNIKQSIIDGLNNLLNYNPNMEQYKILFDKINLDNSVLEKLVLNIK